jgi:hypothetical protein
MNANEIVEKVQHDFARFCTIPINGVVGLSKSNGGWVVTIEALERRAIPDTMDILGLYEIQADSEGNAITFQRKKLRKRGDTEEK